MSNVSDAVQAMHDINAHYQDIEFLTKGDFNNMTQADLIGRLMQIRKINGQIGQITKEWI